MNANQLLKDYTATKNYSAFEAYIQQNTLTKMPYTTFEQWMQTLLATGKTEWIRLINAYFNLLVSGKSVQFLHLILPAKVTAPSRDMTQGYKYINLYNNFIDCSCLLESWSPTPPYFPFLLYVERAKPEKPIDYVPWLKRFSALPNAMKFLTDNHLQLHFTNAEDLAQLYRTIPQQYIADFLDLIKDGPSWYIDVIKDTDHFLDSIEANT